MDASSEERQAISSFLETAQKIVPALKVRFIERLPDEGRPFLRIGVALPDGVKATGDEAYELHQLAADMSDSLPCNLSVWTSPIAGGYELISVEGIVAAENRSPDLVYVMPKLPMAKPMRRIPTLPGQILWIVSGAFCLLLGIGILEQAFIGLGSMIKSAVDSSGEVQGSMSQLKLRREEFLKAIDAYIQSQNKDSKAGPAQAKRLAAMQGIRDKILNANCFTESGKDEKQK